MTQQQQPPAAAPPPPPVAPGGAQLPKGMSVASLVLGILSVSCFGLVTGILATVFGAKARKLCDMGTYGGRGMATAGMVMGIIGTVFGSLWIIWVAVAWLAAD